MVGACPCHHPGNSVGLREEGYKGNKLSVLSLLSQTSAVKTTPRPNTFRRVTACGSVSERRCGTTCSSVDRGPSSNTDNPSEPLTSLGGKGVLGALAHSRKFLEQVLEQPGEFTLSPGGSWGQPPPVPR